MNRTDTLIAALEPLALGSVEQLAYLAEQGGSGTADELASQYDDAFRYAHPMGHAALDAALRALDERFSAMSGANKAALWTPRNLAEGADWAFIREKAAGALAMARGLDGARA